MYFLLVPCIETNVSAMNLEGWQNSLEKQTIASYSLVWQGTVHRYYTQMLLFEWNGFSVCVYVCACVCVCMCVWYSFYFSKII